MLEKLLATLNHTKPRENAKLNSFLQDLLKISKNASLTIYLKTFSQNVDRASRIMLSKLDLRLDGWISRYPGFRWKNRENFERKTKLPRRKGRSALYNSNPVQTGITNHPGAHHLSRPSGRARTIVRTCAF
jgi:hypothetical protein